MAATTACFFLPDRWFLPHFAIRTDFSLSAWDATVEIGWCAQNICLVGFMVCEGAGISVTALTELRLPERSDLILPSSLFGVAFGSSAGIQHTGGMWRIAFSGCWVLPPLGPPVMGPFISLWTLHRKLVSPGASWVVLFGELGRIKLPPIFVKRKVFGVSFALIFLALTNYLSVLT